MVMKYVDPPPFAIAFIARAGYTGRAFNFNSAPAQAFAIPFAGRLAIQIAIRSTLLRQRAYYDFGVLIGHQFGFPFAFQAGLFAAGAV